MLLAGFLLVFTSFLSFVHSSTSTDPLQGLYDLVARRIPDNKDSFKFVLESSDDLTFDSFSVQDIANPFYAPGPFIEIRCNTINGCSRGLYTYLTTIGKVDISWSTSTLNSLPNPPPPVGLWTSLDGASIVQHRYFFNTVTFGYTAVWYGFEKWAYLLDWMALHGINTALAWIGYEQVLLDVLLDVGVQYSDIMAFFPVPTYMPWADAFGNIDGYWGGETSAQWIADQSSLQKLILSRMTELDILPIKPAFPGFVPTSLHNIFPNASIRVGATLTPAAPVSTNVSFVEPSDPLFYQLQNLFLEKYSSIYGPYGADQSHFYTLDQFNENPVPSSDLTYLQNVSYSNLQSIRNVDPEATMMMQDWLFFENQAFWTAERVTAYLSGFPAPTPADRPGLCENPSVILLDMFSESAQVYSKFSNLYGIPWIWTLLHNFGGNQGLEGNLPNLTTLPLDALKLSDSNLCGFGLTMESMEMGADDILYDLLLDQAWSSESIDIGDYVASFVERRYAVGQLPVEVLDAWSLLSQTVYNNTNPNVTSSIKSILELTPAIGDLYNRTGYHGTTIPYDTETTIVPAINSFLAAKASQPKLSVSEEFQKDLVDLTRQLLVYRFQELYLNVTAEFNSSTGVATDMQEVGDLMLELLEDLDSLLATNENFLLSTWVGDAISWASLMSVAQNLNNASVLQDVTAQLAFNESYAAYLEYQARNQITLAGPAFGGDYDYASKQWHGVVYPLYYDRWSAFIDYLISLKTNGTSDQYNATYVYYMETDMTAQWDLEQWGDSYNETWGPEGDLWEVLDSILPKWLNAP